MTRPGGPAEPPGPSWGGAITPSWGERIAAQFFQEYDARWGADPRTTPHEARLPDLARRIDAAMAERGAQIAELRQRLEQVIDAAQRVHASDFSMVLGAALHDGNEALTSTAFAAARCVERARQEGAEEMREKCIALAKNPPDKPTLPAAIRALK